MKKRKIIFLIASLILTFAIIVTILFITKSKNPIINSENKVSKENESTVEEQKEQDKCVTIYDKIGIGTNVNFNGTVYNDKGESFSVNDIDYIGTLPGSYYIQKYYLTTDIQAWEDSYPSWHTCKYIEKIVDTIGKPTTIFQNYDKDEYGYTGSFYLIWDNGETPLVLFGRDYTNWTDYNYTDFQCMYFDTLDESGLNLDERYEMFGKESVKN